MPHFLSWYLIVCGLSNLFHESKFLWTSINNILMQFSCTKWSKETCQSFKLVLEVETAFDCVWRDVFGGIQCCHNVPWLSLPRNEKQTNLPWRRCRAQTEWTRRRAAVPRLFKCKYLTEPVNRYTINMDPLKRAGAWMLPQGPKGHRVKSKKKQWWSFRSVLIEFCYLQQPFPPIQCFQPQHVSIWLSAITVNCDICYSCRRERDTWDMETNVGLSACQQSDWPTTPFSIRIYDVYSCICFDWGNKEKDDSKIKL